MKLQETIPVSIQGNHEQVTRGEVVHIQWDKKERTMRGLKSLGIAWGLAAATILIPILHFILVPLLLLAGPIAFFWTTNQEEILEGGSGECPDCKRKFEIIRAPVKWPLSDICNHCHSPVKINPL
jgi:hypothetical protein